MRAKALAHHTVTDIRHNWRFGLGAFLPPALTGFAVYAFIPPIETGNFASLLPFGGALLLYLALSILAAIAWHRRILLGAGTTVRQALKRPPLLRYLLGSLPIFAIFVITTGLMNIAVQTVLWTFLSGTTTAATIGVTLFIFLKPIALPIGGTWLWCLLGAGLPAISLRRTGRGGQSFWRLMGAGLRHVLPITGAYLRFAAPMGLLGYAVHRWPTFAVKQISETLPITTIVRVSVGLNLLWSLAMAVITIALITRIYDALTAQPR